MTGQSNFASDVDISKPFRGFQRGVTLTVNDHGYNDSQMRAMRERDQMDAEAVLATIPPFNETDCRPLSPEDDLP